MMFIGVMSRRLFIAYRIRESMLLKVYSHSHISILLICLKADIGLEIWLCYPICMVYICCLKYYL